MTAHMIPWMLLIFKALFLKVKLWTTKLKIDSNSLSAKGNQDFLSTRPPNGSESVNLTGKIGLDPNQTKEIGFNWMKLCNLKNFGINLQKDLAFASVQMEEEKFLKLNSNLNQPLTGIMKDFFMILQNNMACLPNRLRKFSMLYLKQEVISSNFWTVTNKNSSYFGNLQKMTCLENTTGILINTWCNWLWNWKVLKELREDWSFLR